MTRRWAGLADWRRVLIYTHRWLGIAGCLVFLVWFVSGVVMMYERMPRLTAEERLVRLPPLDLDALRVSPAEAAHAAGVIPERIRVGTVDGRPVYRLLASGVWTTLFADTGQPLQQLSASEAERIVRRFVPEHASSLRHTARLTRPDQWTLDGGLPNFLPMHRVSLGDAAGTNVYVSERTGDVVMKTTARGRAWGYAGAVLHWTYFAPFREQRELWRYSIIYASLIGCVMCLSGLVIGVWRYSPSMRFRLKRVRSHSPYAGWMWWHHYAGLLFGLTSFTWALSGALSLTPWDWAPSTAPTAEQAAAISGGDLRLDAVTVPGIREAAGAIRAEFEPKELDILQFRGRPFAMAYRAPDWSDRAEWTNPDVSAMPSVQLAIEHRLVWLDAAWEGTFTRFEAGHVAAAAHAAMPGVKVAAAEVLSEYDAYYYDRWHARPLPVLRVQHEDPEGTWLYVDPQHGQIALRHTRLSRLNRWLYNGLHSLDFPFLYNRRPAWDIVLIVLSAGGIALAMTTMAPAWRRLRRHVPRTRG
jgi:hypothetical protein